MPQPAYKPPSLSGAHTLNMFIGVILPAIAITLEATTHICAETFFDPIPSLWYLMLVMFVPIAQLHVWFTIQRNSTQHLARAGWLNVLSLGISIFYSFLYIPLLPLAALTIIFFVGLLPLAPLLSVIAAIIQRRHLKQIAIRAPQKIFVMRKLGLLAGLVITAVFIGLLELPASVTRYGLKLAVSQAPETSAKGIRFLRNFGSREYLLRACYGGSRWATDFFSSQDSVTPAEAQKIYYRVTGKTFDTSPPPYRTERNLLSQVDFDFDSDQGRVKTGGKLKGLSLSNSNIYTKADANGGVAYTEWTLVFLNESSQPREARAEVQLPPGAVVSRLTLWVNGEEHEAVFAGRAKVSATDQQVAIGQRRDPVLVTTSGRDRVLVQCFPVPADHGEMKIRIGITIPLLLQDLNHAQLLFPHFIDRNFRIPDDVVHSVWIESKTNISAGSSALMTTEFTADSFVERGRIPEHEMSNPRTTILLARGNVPTWSRDPFQSGNFIIEQTFDARVTKNLYRIVLVVDTSEAMQSLTDELMAALKSIPEGFDFKLVLADAGGLFHNFTASDAKEASWYFDNATFGGGADNVPALLQAWDLATEKPGNNAIVWVHGPQLLELQSAEELRRRFQTGPYGPSLYSVQTESGADQILKTLDGIGRVKSVARTNDLDIDLGRLFQRLTGQSTTLEWVRTSKKVESLPDPSEAIETSDHLARLWANDEVARILAAGDESLNQAATMLAVRYHLVTPVTGAVVLDTPQQYRATGLTPVKKGTVPTIPEPPMHVLVGLVVAFLLSFLIYRSRALTRG